MNAVRHLPVLALLTALISGVANADREDESAKTVIGPRNPALVDGARELLDGNVEEGLRLSKLGLDVAVGQRERQAGLGNVCAGYVMLQQYDIALEYCDQALSENDRNWRALCNRALIYLKTERFAEAELDLQAAEAIAPNATALKEVRGMLLDATAPVTPNIVIDDRRSAGKIDET